MYNSLPTNFTKNTFGPLLFPNNIFDEKFLKEKESALSPIALDDTVQIQTNTSYNLWEKTNSKSTKDKNKLNFTCDLINEKRKSLNKNSIGSYGSNIIIVSSNQDNDSKDGLIIEEINKLLKDPKNLKIKKTNKRSKYLK